jgi:hypothetical protein
VFERKYIPWAGDGAQKAFRFRACCIFAGNSSLAAGLEYAVLISAFSL